MFLLRNVGDMVSSVASGVASRAGQITSTVSTVATTAVDYSWYVLGYAEVPVAATSNVNMTPEKAYEEANRLGIEDYVKVRQYYSILFASQNPEHDALKLKARCRLACMIAQYSIQKNHESNAPQKPDDDHGLLLAKAKEVNKLLLDIYESNPSAPTESWIADQDIAALNVSFIELKKIITECTYSFAKDHEAFPFDRRNEIQTRWTSWEMIFATFNVTHVWFHKYFEKHETVALQMPKIQLQEIHYAIGLSEIQQLSAKYGSEQIASSAVLERLKQVTRALALPSSSSTRSDVLQKLENAALELKQRTLRNLGMQEYASFLQKSLEDRQSPQATKDLEAVKNFFNEAQKLASLDEPANEVLADIEQKLEELDTSYAQTNIQFYVTQSERKLKAFPAENVSAAVLFEHITWIKQRQAVLNESLKKPFAAPAATSAQTLEDALAASRKATSEMELLAGSIRRLIAQMSTELESKKSNFCLALDEPAGKIAKEIVDASLLVKKQTSQSMSAKLLSSDPLNATFADKDRTAIESLVANYFLNDDLMMNYYKASARDREKCVEDLKKLVSGLFTYNVIANTITLKPLDEIAKNSIERLFTFPIAKLKAVAGSSNK